MKYKTAIFTATCCHVQVPAIIKGAVREQLVDELNLLTPNACRLKDGIEVSFDALRDADREDWDVEMREMIDYLLKFQVADSYLFYE